MISYGLTDVGRIRKNNEDNFAIENDLLIVADGMGGAAAGETASSIAVDTITSLLKDIPYSTDDAIAAAVKKAIAKADDTIKQQARIDAELKGMGTTVVMALRYGDRICLGNVGDSRAYVISGGTGSGQVAAAGPVDANAQTAILEAVDLNSPPPKNEASISRISQDHSVVMDLVNSGVITEEDIRTHPLRNRITRCVGSINDNGADTSWHTVKPGETLILCSDGLWEMVHEDIILAIVSSSGSVKEICKRLIDAANDAGGQDNITVIAALFEET